jgi:3-oxoacyl-[acyl-carrier protein] reductase
MGQLKGKVAVVTGASKGIGSAIAKSLAAAGAAVVVNYSTSKDGADRVVAEIVKKDGKALAVQGDMSKAADVKRVFAEAKNHYGRIDVLVNNAGVYAFAPIEQVTESEFYRQYNTNVLGPVLAIQEALKYFGTAGGSVINVSSVVASNPLANGVVYSSTKAALDAITRGLAKELAPRKIRVNSISPGFTITEGVHAANFVGSDIEKNVVANTPLGRPGQPQDIAPLAVFLASDESGWLTGESIRAAGGLT